MTIQAVNAQDYRSTIVNSMVWSPDGKLLAIGGYGTISIIEADTLKLLYKLHAHEADILSLAWSPDGKSLISNDMSDNGFIWDVKTGEIKGYISANSNGQAPAIIQSEWNFDGSLIADHYDFGGLITIRDGQNGKSKVIRTGGRYFAWSNDTNQLAISTFGKQIEIIDANDGHVLRSFDIPYDVSISTWKGNYLYTFRNFNPSLDALNGIQPTLYHNILQVWDARTGQAISTFDVGSLDTVSGREWSPDGSKVAVRRAGGIFQIWDTMTGKILQTQEFEHRVQNYIWNPTGDGLLLAYNQRDLRPVELPLTGERIAPEHPTNITFYTQLQDSHQYNFITTKLDEAPFEAQSGDYIGYYYAETEKTVYQSFAPYIQWSPDGERFLYPKAIDSNHYELFEKVINWATETQLTNDGGVNLFPIYSPAEFADDTDIAYLHSDDRKTFSLVILGQDRKTQMTLVEGQTLYMERTAWLPQLGVKQIAVSILNNQKNYDIYLVMDNQSQPQLLIESPANDHYPSWSPDAKQLAFVSDRDGDEAIFIYDMATGNTHKLTIGNEPEWSPDGSLIAFRRDQSLYMIDIESGQETLLTKIGWTPRWIPS
jgi:WD40 repeat protein